MEIHFINTRPSFWQTLIVKICRVVLPSNYRKSLPIFQCKNGIGDFDECIQEYAVWPVLILAFVYCDTVLDSSRKALRRDRANTSTHCLLMGYVACNEVEQDRVHVTTFFPTNPPPKCDIHRLLEYTDFSKLQPVRFCNSINGTRGIRNTCDGFLKVVKFLTTFRKPSQDSSGLYRRIFCFLSMNVFWLKVSLGISLISNENHVSIAQDEPTWTSASSRTWLSSRPSFCTCQSCPRFSSSRFMHVLCSSKS